MVTTHLNVRAQGLGELWPLSGAHILHLYLDEGERQQALLDFITAGIARGERICVIHDRPIQEVVSGFGLAAGPAPPEPRPGLDTDAGPFVEDTSRNFYLTNGVFDHDEVYRKWHAFHRSARQAGFSACRALGEVLPELEQVADGQAVVLYEMHLAKAIRACPPTCIVCQYNTRSFRGSTLLGVMRVHPLVLVEGRILANPFFEPEAGGLSH
jgi:hypothetical protein